MKALAGRGRVCLRRLRFSMQSYIKESKKVKTSSLILDIEKSHHYSANRGVKAIANTSVVLLRYLISHSPFCHGDERSNCLSSSAERIAHCETRNISNGEANGTKWSTLSADRTSIWIHEPHRTATIGIHPSAVATADLRGDEPLRKARQRTGDDGSPLECDWCDRNMSHIG